MSTKVEQGSDLMLFITDGAATKTIAYATSHKVTMKMKTKDKSSKDSGSWEEKASGRKEWSISADAMVTFDAAAYSYDDIYALYVASAPITVYSSLATGTAPDYVKATTGAYTGSAFITDLSLDAKDGDNVTFSISLEGTGAFTKAV